MPKTLIIIVLLSAGLNASAQRLVTKEQAMELALNNQRNLKAAGLNVQQQEALLKGAAAPESPELFVEATPYEPLIFGAQQKISMPSVYRNRKSLQRERLRLAQLQLRGSEQELKREVRLSYLQLQYLAEKKRLLLFQDSIFREIKTAAHRFFEAGQINKLDELQAASQADAVTNELYTTEGELKGEMQLLKFYLGIPDSLVTLPLQTEAFIPGGDSSVTNIRQQMLAQEIAIGESELKLQRASLLPEIQAGVSFPTTNEYERLVGFQLGITVPLWLRQNRSRIAAAKAGVGVAKAQQELESQRLIAEYGQGLAVYRSGLQSLAYYNNTALPQARAIIETSQRLFNGGELNYIESLRNLESAFVIFFRHLETHRAFNETVIRLNYLNGTL
ncbi:MAG TPA: TolC family protein [Chitinophagaceae bacterium]